MKRFLAASTALALSASVALAANIPYFSGPIDPGNLLGAFNAVVGSVNANTGGILAALGTPYTTSTTAAETVLAYTLPGGFLGSVGQGVEARVFGTNAADANVRTVTFNFGALAVACIVTGSAAKWFVDMTVYKTGASTQQGECHGSEGTTVVASVQPSAGAVTDTANIALTLTMTNATSGTTVVNGARIFGVK